MTQMPSTHLPAHIYYAIIADKAERDPIVTSSNRATVPMGRGFALWQRMNAGEHLVWVDDMEGTPRALTPKQAQVLALALEMAKDNGPRMTIRAMASTLAVAPSTVSRALTKLNAWGLLASIVGRGRYAGLVIIRRVKGDGMDRFRDAARSRVRRWYDAAQRRISRLQINVAPYLHERGRGSDSLTDSLLVSMGATLKPWTPEDMRELDREMGCL